MKRRSGTVKGLKLFTMVSILFVFCGTDLAKDVELVGAGATFPYPKECLLRPRIRERKNISPGNLVKR